MSDSRKDDNMDDKEYYNPKYCNDYDSYDYDDYDDDYDNDNDNNLIIFNNYDELMYLTEQIKTDNKLNDILYGLIKYVNIIKKKEVGYTFDYTIKPKNEWLNIAKEFNSNIVGSDYRILIDETAIVCYVINDDLLK
jgi:hypothetical protein